MSNIMSVAYNSTPQHTLTHALAHMSKIYCHFRNSSRFRKEWERKSNLQFSKAPVAEWF